MKAILINPFAKTVTEVDYNGKFEQAYKLMDCTMIEFNYSYPKHTIMLDEEGLYKRPTNPFLFNGGMFVGKALLVGGTSANKSATITIQEAHLKTKFPG